MVKYKKLLNPLLILLSFCTVLINFIVHNSFVDQYPIMRDYNLNTNEITIDFINQINATFPNISVTTIPLSGIKAYYYFKEAKYDTAIHIAKKSLKANPYIKFNETIIADSYLQLGALDSALTYAKEVYYNLPNNIVHQDVYMRVLSSLGDIDEMKNVFNNSISSNHEVLYYRYLSSIINRGVYNKDTDLVFAKKAVDLYPSNEEFPIMFSVIQSGIDNILEANKLSTKAENFYREKDYANALNYYLQAEQLIPEEPAYKENIGTTYLQLQDFNNALKYYNIVSDSLNDKSGKIEYLKGYLFFKQQKLQLACEQFLISRKFNNPIGRNLYLSYCN